MLYIIQHRILLFIIINNMTVARILRERGVVKTRPMRVTMRNIETSPP